MSKGHKNRFPNYNPNPPAKRILPQPVEGSLLDLMEDGREYQSIVGKNISVKLDVEMKKAMDEIYAIRKRPIICYISNTLNSTIEGKTSLSIDNSDDGPFIEILKTIPQDVKAIDIILVTPGGSADTVDYFVKKLRDRFDNIAFILPYMAMSAGTIFCLSGDELIMSESAYIGPIDPQVPSRGGMFVPAQSIMTLISTIQVHGEEQMKKGLKPDWTEVQILNSLDPKELGNAITASALSTRLVTEYLELYKFRDWTEHSNGGEVTPEEKNTIAREIAGLLCDNSVWLSHGSRITREIAVDKLHLRITNPETVEGLDRAIRRFWALMQLTLENNPISKIYASGDYFLFRSVNIQPLPQAKPVRK